MNKKYQELEQRMKFYSYSAKANFCISFPSLALNASCFLERNPFLGVYYSALSIGGLVGTSRLHKYKNRLEQELNDLKQEDAQTIQ